ncbi:GerW family sporulation protein [Jeotgalibacillus sp. R-1-5s-1]|uniref:GerW family sporulation protein n=1 Tax=Jeotgalibacillus sp. R-1-5s-1 TaxID=2555897 RepID=UPI00106C1A49|nr:GerW family sporulation protein [Jeotgalibacillus sp. R-1-5s-1]TFD98221.1 sporulation protein YtfJ [Jeotgalibacillus sp. R-1-5s-1]
MEHPIEGVMSSAMEQLKEMVDVNTIIGDPVETGDGRTIMTVSRVRFGYAAGGSEFQSAFEETVEGHPFGGGSGGGVSITPVAFLIVGKEGVSMHHMNEGTHLLEKLMDMAPETIGRIQEMFRKQHSEETH